MAAKGREKKILFVNLQVKCHQNFSCMYEKEGVNTSCYRKDWHAVA